MSEQSRVRRSLQELQKEYDDGNQQPLEDLWRAWRHVQELPPDDPHSFFTLGSYHGAPFRGGGYRNSDYWGGWCHHGNILFPTWHRVYLLKVEEALRSAPGCEHVTLPYWDETSDDSIAGGIPWALTAETVELDGQDIPNPLRSYVFSRRVTDSILNDGPDNTNRDHTRYKNYRTVRYPLAGLVGPADIAATTAHNANYSDEKALQLLNKNVSNWLRSSIDVDGTQVRGGRVAERFAQCLEAPNYTVFSNTTSAGKWNEDRMDDGLQIVRVSLESPHNAIHVAVGAGEITGAPPDGTPVTLASGDMGEPDSAGFDPLFYFHHCFIDHVFWLWQKRHGATQELAVIPQYPGTNTVDSQGPTPGASPNAWLTLESPLDPFRHNDTGAAYTSLDCIDIENQLHYTYSQSSLEQASAAGLDLQEAAPQDSRVIAVHGINRAPISGSFTVSVFGMVGGERVLLGTEAIFSRWAVQGCANCQAHLESKVFFQVPVDEVAAGLELAPGTGDDGAIEVQITGHGGAIPVEQPGVGMALAPEESAAPQAVQRIRVEVR